MSTVRGVLLFLFIVVPLSAFQVAQPAQSNPVSPAEGALAEKPKKASISGRVVNIKTGEPVRKATLMLISSKGAMSGPGGPVSAEADQSGAFAFKDLEPGSYNLMVERQGFVRQMYGARGGNVFSGTPLTVKAGQELTDIQFQMTPQSVIAGKVTDEDGEPLAQVQVAATRTAYIRGKKQTIPVGIGMTNDAGEYRIANLGAGKYILTATFRNLGMAMMAQSADKPADNKPQQGYPPVYYPNSPDATGAAPVMVSSGAEVRAIDFRMVKSRAIRVTGHVTGIAEGRNLLVILSPKGAGVMGAAVGNIAMARGPEGKFEFRGVVPGSYNLTVNSMENGQAVGTRLPVEAADNNIDDLTVPLAGGLDIAGKVVAEGDTPVKLSGVKVNLSPLELAMSTPSGTAGDDASFTIKNAIPDKYEISVGEPPAGYYLKTVKFGGREASDRQVDFSSGAGAPLEIVLSPDAGSVEGTVADKDGKPVKGAVVALVPKSRLSFLYSQAMSDQRGHFEMKALVPGEYEAYAWEEIDMGAFQDPEVLKAFESKALKVKLAERGHESLQLLVIPSESSAEEKQKTGN